MQVSTINIEQFCQEQEADLEMVLDYLNSQIDNPSEEQIDEAIAIYEDYVYNEGLVWYNILIVNHTRMTKRVKDLISELELLNPNESIFALYYTKEDVKQLDYYCTDCYPYTDELAEKTITKLTEDGDVKSTVDKLVTNTMRDDTSYLVQEECRLDSIDKVLNDSPSY